MKNQSRGAAVYIASAQRRTRDGSFLNAASLLEENINDAFAYRRLLSINALEMQRNRTERPERSLLICGQVLRSDDEHIKKRI